MSLPTNRMPGDIIQAVDINQIAEKVNDLDSTRDDPDQYPIDSVTGLQVALDSKAEATHNHDGTYQPAGDYAAGDHDHAASDVTDFSETVDDRVNALLVAGTGLSKTYDDGGGTLTLALNGRLKVDTTKAGADANTLTDSGVYMVGRTAGNNMPATDDWVVFVTDLAAGNYTHQLAQRYVGAGGRHATLYVRSQINGSWRAWQAIPVAGQPGGSDLTGTGMPNGVVSAPPGTYYTDTAGTNGAWRWLKKSGTGNTGWEVVIGDTGWRNIESYLKPGWSGKTYCRRQGGSVTYHFEGTTVTPGEGVTDSAIAIPQGFAGARPIDVGQLRPFVYDTSLKFYRVWLQSTSITIVGATSSPTLLYSAFTAVAETAWPTSLPGVPG